MLLLKLSNNVTWPFMGGKDRLALAVLAWALGAEADVELPDVVEDVQAVSQVGVAVKFGVPYFWGPYNKDPSI